MKLKFSGSIAIAVAAISLLAVSCGGNGNTLNRPSPEASQESANDNGAVAGSQISNWPRKEIKINDIGLKVEVADTDEARTQGLSDRKQLDAGTGVLFDFTNTDVAKPGFWMKDMLFSIDMIWINDGKVIGVEQNVPVPVPDADLPVYHPPSDITHVLEVPAGWSAQNNVSVGSTVSL